MVLLRKSYKDGVKLRSAGCGAAVCRPSRPLGRLLPTERHATGGLRWSAAPLVGRYSSSSGGDSLTCWLLTRCQPFSALKEGTAIQVVHDNAPSADRIVCRGRAGEQVAPPRGSVSDGRQPTERDIQAAAVGGPVTSQGGVWIRLASSRSSRRTWPAHCLLCQFGLVRLVSAGRRADAARLGRLREGPLGPTPAGPSAAAAPCWGARPQAKTPGVSGARAVGGPWPLPAGLRAAR